ncbi:MAG: hypothetical protein GAK43_00017 [Stenotrophomonas maltophilia]|nr:MAG: hypothetical protein GAK43_00017 [Stenotrophomonas maltophilia]
MHRRHLPTLEAVFSHPASGSIRWRAIEALLVALGARLQQREGSRIAVIWNGRVDVFHRPHPSPDTDKGAVASVRRLLEANGVHP